MSSSILFLQVEPELTNVIDLLYEPVFKRFSAVDIDQEIKEHAILCMAQMVSVLGDELADQVAPCLPIFLSRLQNEITRITATKAIAHIAASPLHIDMSPIAQEVYLALASFLRKTSRQLRVTSLMALQVRDTRYIYHRLQFSLSICTGACRRLRRRHSD